MRIVNSVGESPTKKNLWDRGVEQYGIVLVVL